MDKTQAQRAGRALLRRMRGPGWRLDVWENAGDWCYAVRKGQDGVGGVSIYPASGGGFRAFMSNNGGFHGEMWYRMPGDFTPPDPNVLVQAVLSTARTHVAECQRAIAVIADGFEPRPRKSPSRK